jgi:uncharacterized membrane protein YozB (DUF420 family)
MDKAHTAPRHRAPTAVVALPLLIWTLTLVAFSWWPESPRLPGGLPTVVQVFYTPRVTFLALTGLTLLMGWSARHDRQKMGTALGTSVMLAVVYLFMLQQGRTP